MTAMESEIWAELRDWKRPCEGGVCRFREADRCGVWDCIPEQEQLIRARYKHGELDMVGVLRALEGAKVPDAGDVLYDILGLSV